MTGRVPALDGLRGMAILAVLGCHLVWPSPTLRFSPIDRVLVNGWIGVDLFFVLSGFLITGILLERRGAPDYFRSFYTRRALRIFPIYYLFLFVLFVGVPLGEWVSARAVSWTYGAVHASAAWYWTYTVNILQAVRPRTDWFSTGHLWSLSAEEQFYLVWPAVVLLVPRRTIGWVCVAAFAAAPALRAWWIATQADTLGAYVLTPMRMDALAAGALVAVWRSTPRGTALLSRLSAPVTLAAAVAALPLHLLYGSNVQHVWMQTAGYSVNAVVFAALIGWVLQGPAFARGLAWRPLRHVGRVSYGAYLYHLPLIGLFAPLRDRLERFGSVSMPRAAAAHALWVGGITALTLLVATISFLWVEQPLLATRATRRDSARGPAARAAWRFWRRAVGVDDAR